MEGWNCDDLKNYLRSQKGKHSNMNRKELLELAKLYSKKPKEDPKVAEAYEILYADVLRKRKMFLITNKMDRTNIYSFDIILPKEFEFNQITVNTFLTCCDIEIENEVVQTGIDRPADKAQCSK